ncbi:hypothetical protein BLOT_014534, partial [Blomia tropicalis]
FNIECRRRFATEVYRYVSLYNNRMVGVRRFGAPDRSTIQQLSVFRVGGWQTMRLKM